MTYLEEVLKQQEVPPIVHEMLRTRREILETSLQHRWAEGSPRFYYGGSFGKKTMIASQFDLDLVIYFPPQTKSNIQTLYEQVEQRLREAGHAALRRNVAVRLQYVEGFHVDVVPGIATDETHEYADLWATEKARTKRTSIKRHIRTIRESNQREVIRLLKLWRWRNRVPIGSFILELATIKALQSKPDLTLEDKFRLSLIYLRDKFMEATLVDPANPQNIVSADLDEAAKLPVVEAATKSANTPTSQIIW